MLLCTCVNKVSFVARYAAAVAQPIHSVLLCTCLKKVSFLTRKYFAGGAQNAEALFRQTQSGAQQAGSQAYQQANNALSQDTAFSSPESFPAAPSQAFQQPCKVVKGRMLTFVSAGGKATLSSTAQTGSEPTSGDTSVQSCCLSLLALRHVASTIIARSSMSTPIPSTALNYFTQMLVLTL